MEKDKAEKSTDWDRIEKMSDAEIEQSVKDDPDAAPILTDDQMKEYKVTPPKVRR